VTNYGLLFRHRLQLFAKAAEVGVTRACRELGLLGSHIHRRAGYSEWSRMTVRISTADAFRVRVLVASAPQAALQTTA
jgi:hypothetical protein